MRRLGAVVLFLGLVAAIAGAFMGCGSMFSWNGRHATNVVELPAVGAFTHRMTPELGRRYTLAIQIVFDRSELPLRDGAVVLEARFPLVARVTDAKGGELASTIGWLDPNEPPTVLFGQAQNARKDSELYLERLVGPVIPTSEGTLAVSIDVGEDRTGTTRVLTRRLIVYDDALPPSIARAFMLAGAGVFVFVLGIALLVASVFRPKRGKAARSRSMPTRMK